MDFYKRFLISLIINLSVLFAHPGDEPICFKQRYFSPFLVLFIKTNDVDLCQHRSDFGYSAF